jgi:hypothetical protein
LKGKKKKKKTNYATSVTVIGGTESPMTFGINCECATKAPSFGLHQNGRGSFLYFQEEISFSQQNPVLYTVLSGQ